MRAERVIGALVRGGPLAPGVEGTVIFHRVAGGTLICADINGLPHYRPATPAAQPIGPHGFHIHENGVCDIGDPRNPFQAAGGHWNPDGQPHGNHAGDLPVLFSHDGRAYMEVFTNRFRPRDVLGKTVIIHQNPDDYRSQPAGNAGLRLACGVIGWLKGS